MQNFKDDMEKVIDIKCLSGMSANLLSQSYLKRAEALKNVILSGSKLNLLISDKNLLNSLTRRIKGSIDSIAPLWQRWRIFQ